jgi:purine-binding chemotaxis protein CheW
MTDLVKSQNSAVATAKKGAGGGDTHQYLTFTLGSEMFAVGILNVKEIIEYGNLTEIPMMPAFIRGVINLRGAVVPVVDLAARFGGKISEVQRRTCIVIVEVTQEDAKHDIGIMVDAVSEVLEIQAKRDRTAAVFRRQDPRRFHRRHGQGRRQVRHHPADRPRPLRR